MSNVPSSRISFLRGAEMNVANVAHLEPVTVSQEISSEAALPHLQCSNRSMLLVVDDQNHLRGAVSEAALIAVMADPKLRKAPISKVMGTAVKVEQETDVHDLVALFAANPGEIVVLVRNDEPVGIVDPSLVLGWLSRGKGIETSQDADEPRQAKYLRRAKNSASILIVESCAFLAEQLHEAVQPFAAKVLCCSSGIEALRCIRMTPPDVILLSCDLPDIDSLAVIDRLQKDALLRSISIILLIAPERQDLLSSALQSAECDYVYRPYTTCDIQTRLDSVLRIRSILQLMEDTRQNAILSGRAKSEVLAHMSHEIRTPLSSILGFTEVLEDTLQRDIDLEHLRTIRRNGQHLLQLINDVLDIEKIVAGEMQIDSAPCSPREILNDALSSLQLKATSKKISLTSEVLGEVPSAISTDPLRLQQILTNLIGNAIKFTSDGGVHVVMQVQRKDDTQCLHFSVIDSGIGISPAEQVRLFQPFQQANGSISRKFGGAGLGLAISQRLARMLGGNVTVVSEPGKGSTFTLTIDCVELAERANFAPSESGEEPNHFALQGWRVLVAEDGVDNQRLINCILSKAGAIVHLVADGQQAVDAVTAAVAKGTPYDAVLMDVQMPVLDGCDATRQLRASGIETPIIALTAMAMKVDRSRCLTAGCDDFVTKPFQKSQLLAALQQFQDGASKREHAVMA